MTISVVVADDQPLIRAGISMLLRSEPGIVVAGEASSGEEAIELTASLHPDIVVMDVQMPGMGGVTATRVLAGDPSHRDHLTKILVLTMFNDDEAVHGALRAGASGFILKHAAPSDLIAAVRKIAEGDAWIDPAVAKRVIDALARVGDSNRVAPELVGRLTSREREVLTLMAEGLSNGEIRDRLVISEATVKTHVARVVMKTGSRDRTQAVVLAYQSGLVTPRRAGPTTDTKGNDR